MARAISRMLPIDGPFRQFGDLWVEKDGVVVGFAGWPVIQLTPGLALAPARFASLALQYDPADWRDDPLVNEIAARARALEVLDLEALNWSALLATVDEALELPFLVMELRRHYLPRTILALGGLRVLLERLGKGDQFGSLLSGVDNMTLEANRGLENLASLIRADPALAAIFARHDAKRLWSALESEPAGRNFLPKLQSFLDRYGHRETASPLLMSEPTWKDAPEVVLGILKGLALQAVARREGQPDWEIPRDEVLAHPALRLPPLRSAFLRLLEGARLFPSLREDTHFMLTKPLPILRRTFLELGRRLAEIDVLESAEDVFHLRFDELKRVNRTWPPSPELAAEQRDTARRRKARRAELADEPLLNKDAITDVAPIAGALVGGMPGSPGVAEGPVRVVRKAADFGSFRPGEVLVAPYTNPSWTPLFGRAAAVVVDAGSVVSHAAIVAREYGIPAVMGTGDGTNRLADDQWVRVDGFRGQVFPASTPSEDAAPGVAVDTDGQHEDGAGGDRMPERGDAVEIQRV
jgi:pyruvate,water dikinase